MNFVENAIIKGTGEITMEDNFVLSEKITRKECDDGSFMSWYHEQDIKRFIRRDKELIIKLRTGKISEANFWKEREKLVGRSLKGK